MEKIKGDKSSKNTGKTNTIISSGVFVSLIALFARIPLTRVIGDEGNGIYAAAFEVFMLILLLAVNCIPEALSKIISVRLAREQYKNANRAFKVVSLWVLIISIICCAFLLGGAAFVAEDIMLVPMSALAIKMLAPVVIIMSMAAIYRGYFQGMGTTMPTSVSKCIEQITGTIASIVASLFMCNYGIKVAHLLHNNSFAAAYAVMGIALGTLIGAFLSLLFLLFVFMLYKQQRVKLLEKDTTRGSESNVDVLRSFLYVLIPLIITAGVFRINYILDQILYNGVMTGTGQASEQVINYGIYAGKYQVLVQIPVVLASMMWLPMIPALQSAYQRVDMRLIRNRIAVVYRLTMIVVMPFMISLIFLARPVLNMFFRGDVTLSAQLLQYGSSFILFSAFAFVGNAVLQGINRVRTLTINVLVALIIHVIALMVMLKYLNLGIFAVVYANILMVIIICILNQATLKKYLKYNQEWIRTVAIPFAASMIVGFIAFAIHKVLEGGIGNNAALIIACLIETIAYISLLIAFRAMNEKEIKSMPAGKIIVKTAKLFHLL